MKTFNCNVCENYENCNGECIHTETFCGQCNHNFGDEKCFNCVFFDVEFANRLESIQEPSEIQKDFIRFAKINLRDNCFNEAIFYLKELHLV